MIYIEGAGPSKDQKIECRKGFRQLLERSSFKGRMPKLVASGSRNAAFDDFKNANKNAKSSIFIAMLIDSEDPVKDTYKTWDHLKKRDNWDKPEGATDEQVLFMTTCMETWIVTDRKAIKGHFHGNFHDNSLLPLQNIEQRDRHEVHDVLVKASKNCTNRYKKGDRSFEILGKLDPEVLRKYLPSFKRMIDILSYNCPE